MFKAIIDYRKNNDVLCSQLMSLEKFRNFEHFIVFTIYAVTFKQKVPGIFQEVAIKPNVSLKYY